MVVVLIEARKLLNRFSVFPKALQSKKKKGLLVQIQNSPTYPRFFFLLLSLLLWGCLFSFMDHEQVLQTLPPRAASAGRTDTATVPSRTAATPGSQSLPSNRAISPTPHSKQQDSTRHGAGTHARPQSSPPRCCSPPLSFEGAVGGTPLRVSTPQLQSIVTRLYSATPSRSSGKGVRTPGAPCVRLRSAPVQRQADGTVVQSNDAPPMAAAVKLSAEEEKESIDRLYNVSVRHHATTRQKLKEKYLFHWSPTPSEQTKKELDAHIVQKFYTSEPDRQRKRREELLAKYVATTEPKMSKRSGEELRSIVDRLFKKE